MEIDMHIFSVCTQNDHKRIHFSRVTYETLTRVFPLQVLQDLPIHLQDLQVSYNTLMCILHPYYPAVGPVASGSLVFDVQVVTLLLGKYALFAHVNLCYSTTRLRSYFSTIFAAHLRA